MCNTKKRIYLFLSVLEASSENIGTCKQNDRLCFEDLECCSGNCRRFFTFKKYCKTPIIETVKQFISPKSMIYNII